MNARKRYRRVLLWIFGAALVFCAFFSYFYIQNTIPDRVNVVVQEEENFNFSLPMAATLTSESQEVSLLGASTIPSDAIDLVLDEDFQIVGSSTGSYSVSCKLLRALRSLVDDTRYMAFVIFMVSRMLFIRAWISRAFAISYPPPFLRFVPARDRFYKPGPLPEVLLSGWGSALFPWRYLAAVFHADYGNTAACHFGTV